MACSSPLYRFNAYRFTGVNLKDEPHRQDDFDKAISILPYSFTKRIMYGGVIVGYNEYQYLIKTAFLSEYHFEQIPCGKCIGCRLKYSSDWASRCMIESKDHLFSQFVTLTYRDEELTPKLFLDKDGCISIRAELDPDHLQKFMKDIRRRFEYHYGEEIRFFGSGEYGPQTLRPHYHVILFGAKFRDAQYFDQREGLLPYFQSDMLDSAWKRGQCLTTDVTWNTCAYVARYTMKKLKGPSKKNLENLRKQVGALLGQDFSFQDPFVRMSRKPGIGRNFYEREKADIYNTDEIFVDKNGQILPTQPFRYYDKLYDLENHDELRYIKFKRRKKQELIESLRRKDINLTDNQYRALLELGNKIKVNSLRQEL